MSDKRKWRVWSTTQVMPTKLIEAYSADEACEIWAANYDLRTVEYSIANGENVELWAREDGAEGPSLCFVVSGRMRAEYNARKRAVTHD